MRTLGVLRMILPGFFLCSGRRKKERSKKEIKGSHQKEKWRKKEADDGLDALPIWVGLGLLITIEVSSPAFISSNAVTGINGKQNYYGPDGISLAERYILCYSGINGYNTEISLEFFLSGSPLLLCIPLLGKNGGTDMD